MEFQYYTADAFTGRQFHGAPIAVFPDSKNLDAPTMARIAGELGLSETVFVFPCDTLSESRVRAFGPTGEVEFAGQPVIATAHVLTATGANNAGTGATKLLFHAAVFAGMKTEDGDTTARPHTARELFEE